MKVALPAMLITIPLLILASCDKPIQNMTELDGCYFAGTSQTPAFAISHGELRTAQVRSIVSISSTFPDGTKLHFAPGIYVTDDVHKSTILVGGDEIAGLAFQSGAKKYIQLGGGGFPVRFEQRRCPQRML